MEISRIIDLNKILDRKSCFLFGARSVGKTFWIRRNLKNISYYNLLKISVRRSLLRDPQLLVRGEFDIVVVDEIQKAPELLDEIHEFIESGTKHRFLLTGSSARKLRRSGANLLGGRAAWREMGPLTFKELSNADQWHLQTYLERGGLPRVYLGKHPLEELDEYISVYLNEEIREETNYRNLTGFQSFLFECAPQSGHLVNYQEIASTAHISIPTVKDYFSALEDTLIGHRLPAWNAQNSRNVRSDKFYLFDVGVKNHLIGVKEVVAGTKLFGDNFEAFIFAELTALKREKKLQKLAFWRDHHKHEVDFIIDDFIAVDVKSSEHPSNHDAHNLRRLKNLDQRIKYCFLISRSPLTEEQDGVLFLPYEEFLNRLWDSKLL